MHGEIIPENEYQDFVASHQNVSFLQSLELARRRQRDGYSFLILGVKKESRVVAAAIIHRRAVIAKREKWQILQGPTGDWDDLESLQFFFEELTRLARTYNVLELEVSLPVARIHRDGAGDPIDDGYESVHIDKIAQKAGLVHQPYGITDKRADVFRWYFVKSLSGISDGSALLASYTPKARWAIRKATEAGVTVRKTSTPDDIAAFYELCKKAEQKHSFTARTLTYYQDMLHEFGDKAFLLLAEISSDHYRSYLQTAVEKHTDNISHTSSTHEKRVSERAIATNKRLLDTMPKEETILIAGGMFINYGREMTYLFSGADQNYRFLEAPSAIQHTAMSIALKEGCTRYNFYGTQGAYSGQPERESVYHFKKGFRGYVVEQLGVYTYTPRPFINLLVRQLAHIRQLLR